MNPFDFHDIPQDNYFESNFKNFLDIAENNVVVFENDLIPEVFKKYQRWIPVHIKR